MTGCVEDLAPVVELLEDGPVCLELLEGVGRGGMAFSLLLSQNGFLPLPSSV